MRITIVRMPSPYLLSPKQVKFLCHAREKHSQPKLYDRVGPEAMRGSTRDVSEPCTCLH